MAAPAGPAAAKAKAKAKEPLSVDPHLWMAWAGAAARVPAVGRDVYYVPEGHCEQCPRAPDFGGVRSDPLVLCRVVGVRYLANPDTDEAFAVIALEPGRLRPPPRLPPAAAAAAAAPGGGSAAGGGGGRVVSFAKMLTPSDANNGGGFSVPRYCADSIFPPLDMEADPPLQYLTIYDVHGEKWKFRHIYRGTPRRHLLTTGWSGFVNAKKLVAGDVVVFARDETGDLFVGIRRAYRAFPKPGPGAFPHREDEDEPEPEPEPEPENVEGFSRCVRGRVPPPTVVEAVRLAKFGRPFEVMYYPKAGAAEFVVPKEAVDASLMVNWCPGIRVRMSVETEDSSRTTWYQGTVEENTATDMGPWPRSPWRMLKIDWDEKEAIKDVKKDVKHVSPWDVELVIDTPQIQAPFPALKKLKMLAQESPGFFGNKEGNMVSLLGLKNQNMGVLFTPLLNYTTSPAGMQGARHDPLFLPGLSTPPSIALEDSSPQNQGRILDASARPFKAPASDSRKDDEEQVEFSFRLFGQLLKSKRSREDELDNKYTKEREDVISLGIVMELSNRVDLQLAQVSRRPADS